MKYFIGIDGGGTKTAIAVSGDNGEILYSIQKSGCSYTQIGIDGVVELISGAVEEILQIAGISQEDCAGCCIGLPCYGEYKDKDSIIKERLEKALSPIPVLIVNDVVVGWAGSLECGEGIHIVAGTGAIAYGRTENGEEARSGGWSEFFSDEGSCYWVGKMAMGLFSKEADGRKPKSALYHIVKEELNIENDYDFIDIIHKAFAPFRDKVASFQLYAKKAALAGDKEAKKLYTLAAKELSENVKGLLNILKWTNDKVKVSYYGGLFRAGELILEPLKTELEAIGCILEAPKHTATSGALLLCIKNFN